MSETPMRGDADERAALLTMPAGAVNEEVRAATEESIFLRAGRLMWIILGGVKTYGTGRESG